MLSSVSVQYEYLHTIIYKPFFICLGVGQCKQPITSGSSEVNVILMLKTRREKVRTEGKHMEFYLDRTVTTLICMYI